ncbi:MAG: hypothetical protein ACRES3_09715 [Steroidobacteraceae bacterium]
MSLALPSSWNRSRATALAVTLLLHVVVAAWLLALRFESPARTADEAAIVWLPAPALPPPVSKRRSETSRVMVEPDAPVSPPSPEPVPTTPALPNMRDWHGDARDVAGAIGGGPGRRRFGETPEPAPERRKVETPPSIWKKPLPRVGTTVTTPEGETILWVSDYCYISLYSRSLTMQAFHQVRQGVRTCVLYQFGGEKEARGDLFDAIKRPP